jgi:Rod binding domain-containing protein
MQISAIQPKIDASHLDLESLAGNKALTEDQNIGEASRQFEAVLLRQFLTESQKTVIKSEFTDDSTASGIYQDFITNQLADSLSRGGGIGLAKSFQRQLSHPAAHPGGPQKIGSVPVLNGRCVALAAHGGAAASPPKHFAAEKISHP